MRQSVVLIRWFSCSVYQSLPQDERVGAAAYPIGLAPARRQNDIVQRRTGASPAPTSFWLPFAVQTEQLLRRHASPWKPALCFLALLVVGASCQRAALPPALSQAVPRTIVVKGAFFGHKDTVSVIRQFDICFSRRLPDGTTERIIDPQMPLTGRYRVRVALGQTYRTSLAWRGCSAEEQEYYTTDNPGDSVLVKNFYLNYPDSTHYGGCLAEWEKRGER